jgi:hypothetical protein
MLLSIVTACHHLQHLARINYLRTHGHSKLLFNRLPLHTEGSKCNKEGTME